MWSGWLLFLLGATWTSQVLTGLSCLSDFITNVTCEWHNSTQHAGQVCTLNASRATFSGTQKETCDLQPLRFQSNAARGCWIAFESLRFTFLERIKLEVICNDVAVISLNNYQPGRNIKLRPLARPSVVKGNISWSRGTESVMQCEYELQFKSASQIWKDIKPRKVYYTSVVLDNDSLILGGQYEARVRVKPIEPQNRGQFLGQWSDWSPSIAWTSEIGRNKSLSLNTQDTVTLASGLLMGFIPVILVLLISIIVCAVYRYYCTPKVGCEHIPDPSKYFQPLLSVHGGNFQKWLGPQHPAHSFLTPQPCDCDISPVEVSDIWDNTLANAMAHFHNDPMSSQQTSGDSQSSSGFSNMGYFYSETQAGSLSLETCSVYFSYQPDGSSQPACSLQSTSSYERLQGQDQQQGEPSSPDSGFGMGGEEEEGDDEESKADDKEEEWRKEECSGINIQHLVSFFLSLPESSKMSTSTAANHNPLSSAQLSELPPWPEDAEVADTSNTSEAPDGAVVRPSSMVVQPCSSGYLTLKEMQKYSNKSI